MRNLMLLGTLLLTLSSCKNRFSESALQSADYPDRSHVEEFRAIFAQAVGRSEAEMRELVYLPVRETEGIKKQESADVFFRQLGETYRAVSPDQLYQASGRATLTKVSDGAEKALRQTPITFVLVPGVFGEFITTRPMEDILEKSDSAASLAFKKAMAASRDESSKKDAHFNLDAFKDVTKPLDELIATASLDDRDGTPLLRVVGFTMPLMSLESLGSNDDISALYLRRLEKFFKITGKPDNIVFLGYSRGAGVALNMMSRARNEDWFKNVRGFVGLGGVIYGSDLADQAFVKGAKEYRQFAAIDALVTTLRTLEDVPVVDRPAVIARNTAAWARFAKEMVGIDPKFATATLSNSKGAELGSMFVLLREVWRNLNLDNFFTGYSENIVRFKRVAGAITTAIRELSTQGRMEWWRKNTVPADGLTYYAITATMADPDTSTLGAKVAASVLSYGNDSFDNRTLTAGYRDYVKRTGFALNDSQVAVHRARFWPDAHGLLNPAQAPLNTRFLGVLGTHHWALALRVVNEMKDGTVNPFPRAALLKAIATKIAWDQQRLNAE